MLAAITVNTLTDGFDLSDGLISLREAIVATNINAAFGDAPAGDVDGDSIRIVPALAGQTITLSSGQLAITDDLIIRGFGTTIGAAADSRIFTINTSEEVVLSRLNLENGDASQGAEVFGPIITQGGAVRFEGGGTLRLFQSHFSNNSARLGGAVYATGGNIYVTESTFSNNTAFDATSDPILGGSSAGGALYFAGQSATTVILSSTFEGNVAELGNGGAISVGNSDRAFIFSSDFTNNTANTNRDNAVRINTSPVDFAVLIDASAFGGGAIYSHGFVRVGQSIFTDNGTADGSGGAIFAGGSRFVVANTSFENNVADDTAVAGGAGGGVYLENGINSRFNNVSFLNNEATNFGAAIVVAEPLTDPFSFAVDQDEPPSSLTIRSSSFQGNRSKFGGAISLSNFLAFQEGNAVISDTTFLGNVSSERGGAIHNDAVKLQIYHSTFENNEAPSNDFFARGGAVYSRHAEVEIAFSSFSDNVARFGGAVALDEFYGGSDLTIFESEFRNNRAVLPVGDPQISTDATLPIADGGAVFVNSTSSFSTSVLLIAGGLFEDNIATHSGGAVSANLRSSELVISPSRNGATQFIGNRAINGDGGAISTSLNTAIRDAVFSENTARNGAGIYMGVPSWYATPTSTDNQLTLSGAQITENEAQENGGGVFIQSGAAFVNNSSNINSNTATDGADIFEE